MEDIDKTIAEFKMQNQIDDYLYKNIYPDFSSKKNNKNIKCCYNKKETSDYVDIIYNTNISLEKINKQDYINFENISKKLENIENEIIEINNIQCENIINENDDNNNICPICIEPIGNKSYLMMKCNHSICGSCCYHNFTKNNHTALLCPICRTHLL